MLAPRHLHFAVVCRIIRYLQGSSRRGPFFPRGTPLWLVAYSDADWAGCPNTRQSVTGWCMFLSDSLISWKSKKQDHVSKSSAESEYRAMSAACSKILWLRGLLAKIVVFSPSLLLPMLTTLVPFRLLPISSFMSVPNTLRWIVILFGKYWTVV